MELLLGLSTETSDHIGGKSHPRNLSHFLSQFYVGLSCMISSHTKQHVTIATLSRKMDVFAYVVVLADNFKNLFREIFGMG